MRHASDIHVSFDEITLLSIGDFIEGDGLGVALQFGAQSVGTIGSDYALIRDFGNTSASFELPCVVDFESVDAAHSYQARQLKQWSRGRVAELRVGENIYPQAALSGFSCNVAAHRGKARVYSRYSFIASYHD